MSFTFLLSLSLSLSLSPSRLNATAHYIEFLEKAYDGSMVVDVKVSGGGVTSNQCTSCDCHMTLLMSYPAVEASLPR